ncbi:ATP/GTP-binding protein [Bacteroides helcogenes]|uniref:ATP-binding protein n=1 Tax=Bacteroides helcogenes (strain ATCC 35417 / DSM 20613 / JCM 6297 / CCUG 15421 / P 36-108) TaxID=693979 RepID=E6SRM3_BACT6|nr:ATP-binding protein [Bacteroides helcogenes]ADV45113.1 putative ATP-binding protein [Bacteroides helcogenes P 36-108]MDY5238673.1 ATP-binding protein [Bacteroides helcogenes]
MIAEFNIENFFSIKSAQKISFEPSTDTFMSDEYSYEIKDGVRLLKVGIIYGANASGKTNILNAIEFFRLLVLRMPKDRNEATKVIPFMLDDTSRNEKTKMSMTFYINQSKYVLSFELNSIYIYSETLIVYDSIRPTKLYSRSYDATTDSTTIEFGANLKMTKKSQDVISGNTINNCSVLAAFGKSNVERTRLNDVYDYFAKQVKDVLAPGMLLSGYIKSRLNNDETGDLKKFILNFLKASDFNIEDVVLNEEEELITPELEQLIQNAPIENEAKAEMLKKGKITNAELTFKHKAGDSLYDLSEDYESNGTMRFMGLAVILNFLLKTNRFVPIDEVETSIHYELLAYFLKVFLANSNGTSQMLLTTHDINLLNEDFIRRDTIWFTDKDELGETKIVRLSNLGLHKNLSPYNAYKQGKLVKLPFLGSQYIDLNN